MQDVASAAVHETLQMAIGLDGACATVALYHSTDQKSWAIDHWQGETFVLEHRRPSSCIFKLLYKLECPLAGHLNLTMSRNRHSHAGGRRGLSPDSDRSCWFVTGQSQLSQLQVPPKKNLEKASSSHQLPVAWTGLHGLGGLSNSAGPATVTPTLIASEYRKIGAVGTQERSVRVVAFPPGRRFSPRSGGLLGVSPADRRGWLAASDMMHCHSRSARSACSAGRRRG